ncbi:tyrosine-type recombinase/integrase [Mobiluncus curtisii]|uniref:tyrosine-type recombinase/integrase n=1 Tax=Mobiluncus curtisii TaxID=2051 RepID=UPI00242B991B|nr:site-specific integrase [Mobiluncus curtisii]
MAGKVRKNSFGNVDKRPSGNFRARYTNPRYGLDDSEPRYISRTFAHKTSAQDWLHQQKADIDRNVWLSPLQAQQRLEQERRERERNERTFADYAIQWLEFKKTDWKNTTTARYVCVFRDYVLPYWGGWSIKEITKADVRTWIAKGISKTGKDGKQVSYPNSAKKAFEMFRGIMLAAESDEVIDRAPIAPDMIKVLIKNERESPNGRSQRALASEELYLLMYGKDTINQDGEKVHVEGLPPQYALFTLFMAVTGLRIGEAKALRRSDFNFKTNTFKVSRQYTRNQIDTPKTKSSARTMQMADELAEMIKQHLAALPVTGKDGLVFPGKNGGFIVSNSYTESLDYATKRLGLKKFRPHDLRRTAITNLLQQGVSLKDVQDFSRHETPSLVLRYAQANTAQHKTTATIAFQAALAATGSNVTQLPTAVNN